MATKNQPGKDAQKLAADADDRETDFEPDWSAYPKLASLFEHRPKVNVYWAELRALLREARADGVKFIKDASSEQLAAARVAGVAAGDDSIRRRLADVERELIAERARTDALVAAIPRWDSDEPRGHAQWDRVSIHLRTIAEASITITAQIKTEV